jgi:hypothetical protein
MSAITIERRNRNENYLVWPIFEEYDQFTPVDAPRVDSILVSGGWMSCYNALATENQVNQEILSGRIARFTSMDELICDLDQKD